jgi:hypothetical protein
MEATTNFLLQTITGSQSNTLLQSIDLVTVWLGQLDGAWLAAFLKSTVFKNDDKEILQNVDKEFRLKHREVVEKAVQCTYNLWFYMQRIRSALHVLIEGLTKSDLEITFVGLTRLQEGVKKIKTDMDEVTKLYADLLSNLSELRNNTQDKARQATFLKWFFYLASYALHFAAPFAKHLVASNNRALGDLAEVALHIAGGFADYYANEFGDIERMSYEILGVLADIHKSIKDETAAWDKIQQSFEYFNIQKSALVEQLKDNNFLEHKEAVLFKLTATTSGLQEVVKAIATFLKKAHETQFITLSNTMLKEIQEASFST